jgi:uncharacterized membrane protein
MENRLMKLFNIIILLGIVGLLIMGMYGLITEQYGIAYVSFVAMAISVIRVVFDPYKD